MNFDPNQIQYPPLMAQTATEHALSMGQVIAIGGMCLVVGVLLGGLFFKLSQIKEDLAAVRRLRESGKLPHADVPAQHPAEPPLPVKPTVAAPAADEQTQPGESEPETALAVEVDSGPESEPDRADSSQAALSPDLGMDGLVEPVDKAAVPCHAAA